MFDPVFAVLMGAGTLVGVLSLYWAARMLLFFVLGLVATANENLDK